MAMTKLQHALNRVAGEAAELVQIALKAQEFGILEMYRNGPDNHDRIAEEYNDLLGTILHLNNELKAMRIQYITAKESAIDAKVNKILEYRGYSQQLGQVEK